MCEPEMKGVGGIRRDHSVCGLVQIDVDVIGREALEVAGPGGTVICNPALNPDPGCVPINIFTAQNISKAAINFLSINSFSSSNNTERVASLAFTGKLGDYGIKSPYASEGVGVALGGAPGARLATRLASPVSRTTLLRA